MRSNASDFLKECRCVHGNEKRFDTFMKTDHRGRKTLFMTSTKPFLGVS
jgi:hypothetical protein